MQVAVNAQAGPCIDGRIAFLGLGELRGLPVGELLPFADFLLENNGIDFLKAHVGDAKLFDHLLQFDESCRMDVTHARQLVEVVGGR